MQLSMLLDMAADAFGDRLILGRRACGYSAEDVRRLSIGGAALIRDSGADALVYLDVNGPCFPVALFAAARAGVPIVPLNYRLGAGPLRHLLAYHPGALAISSPASRPLFERTGVPVYTTDEWLGAAGEASNHDQLPVETGKPAVIIYTSGTTSAPKGVLLRHHNLIHYVLGTVEFAGASESDASLVSVPPYHIAAVANAITNLYAGRRSVVLEQFSGDMWLDLVRTEDITHALVVPTMLGMIMAVEADKSVPTLQSLAYGGAAMPVRTIEKALRTWPDVDFVNAYGLTETSSTISVLGPDEHRAALKSDDPVARSRLASAGVPMPGIEIEIRDESGRALGAGALGRIFVRGDQVSGEYADRGSTLDADGWFDTRDEGYLDDAGYLFVGGRTDDTIIRGGENIAPAEIEDVLLSHPDVDDAVVVGVPHPEWGQRLEAAVVLRAGCVHDTEAIRGYVRHRLRTSKTPDRIVVWDKLPRNDLGKIVRRDVVELIGRPDNRST
jgi:acyl-CoA synthetase (AMP-forming)/AMP-acid ligase II